MVTRGGNRTYHLPVCAEHQIDLSFTLGYRMPKHWRERHVRCSKTNCYAEADYWLVIEISEEVLGNAPTPGERRHMQASLELEKEIQECRETPVIGDYSETHEAREAD